MTHSLIALTSSTGVYALNSIFEGVDYLKPTNVKAFGRLSMPGESETSVTAILDFPNGATATMVYSINH